MWQYLVPPVSTEQRQHHRAIAVRGVTRMGTRSWGPHEHAGIRGVRHGLIWGSLPAELMPLEPSRATARAPSPLYVTT